MPKRNANAVDVVIGSQLRKLRKQHKLSQQSLGGLIGVTHTQVQKFEAGSNRMSAAQVFALAAHFKVPIDYFYPTIVPATPKGGTGTKPRLGMQAALDFAATNRGFQLISAFNDLDPGLRDPLIAFVQSAAKKSKKSSERQRP